MQGLPGAVLPLVDRDNRIQRQVNVWVVRTDVAVPRSVPARVGTPNAGRRAAGIMDAQLVFLDW